jgi:ubiquinone/menaquinone biosynthesis C-methylase UbiE
MPAKAFIVVLLFRNLRQTSTYTIADRGIKRTIRPPRQILFPASRHASCPPPALRRRCYNPAILAFFARLQNELAMLDRILEPEVMDTPAEARDYDAMDHAAVNRRFVDDFLADFAATGATVLDLGAGTAQIPIELCRRDADLSVVAVDAAAAMLAVAAENVERAGLASRIALHRADAKRLSYPAATFDAVISNSIVHHIPEPRAVLAEAVRVTRPGGTLFFRDLMRPQDRPTLDALVDTYAAGANGRQRRMFAESLHAALALDEIRELVAALGFAPQSVQATSDRHWTWSARRPMSETPVTRR